MDTGAIERWERVYEMVQQKDRNPPQGPPAPPALDVALVERLCDEVDRLRARIADLEARP